MIIALFLCSLFLILAGIHLYWSFGGAWGLHAALPTNENGERVLHPKKITSAMVGVLLGCFALFYLFKSGLFPRPYPNSIAQYGAWIIPCIFLLRAMGDFNYVGFFKKNRKTDFAKLDTSFFSPLCLGIGILGVISQLIE